MRPKFHYNDNKVKNSCDQYRNINGIYYECWTSDNTIFKEEKRKAKAQGLKCRLSKVNYTKKCLEA